MSTPTLTRPSPFLATALRGALSASVGETLLLIALAPVARAFLRPALLRHLLLGGRAVIETAEPDGWVTHARLGLADLDPRQHDPGEHDRLFVLGSDGEIELTVLLADERSAPRLHATSPVPLDARAPGETALAPGDTAPAPGDTARPPGETGGADAVIDLRRPPLATVHRAGARTLTAECVFLSAPAAESQRRWRR